VPGESAITAFLFFRLCSAGWAGSDSVLVAYALDPVMEKSIAFDDGKTSGVWQTWGQSNLQHILLTVASHGRSRSSRGFESEQDALMKVRAAYGSRGIYFLLEICDDRFGFRELEPRCEQFTWLEWRNDGVDLFLDALPPEVLFKDTSENFFLPGIHFSRSSALYQYRVSGEEPAGWMYSTRYNPGHSRRTGIRLVGDSGDSTYFVRRRISATIEGTAGGSAGCERILLDSLCRALEWFVPYSLVGNGIPAPAVDKGGAIAVNFCYSDMDDRCSDGFDDLKWRRDDPWAPEGAWGTLVFGPRLAGITTTFSGVQGAWHAGAQAAVETTVITETYTAAGAPLPGPRADGNDTTAVGIVVTREKTPSRRVFLRTRWRE
jgi:hypothetical protein